jgi:hypothetical protein
MLLLRRKTGTQKGAIKDMHAYAVFAVNEHMEYLLAEAAQRRALRADKPSLRERIASAAATVRNAVDAPADYSKSILPKLNDYPYRS